ncbi:MAG: 3-oxoacyl-[acyl-carrier protein] reductase [Chloroflexi bacterium]|nr:MAG: 3-oxoacyl-[acyl-carrier protein] reductase [Chloroflexota bacterium]
MSRRVAIIADANIHLGPDLARELAAREHDLVLSEPSDGLADELIAAGANVEAVTGTADLTQPQTVPTLIDAALSRFDRLDAACIRTGRIITGDIFQATVEDLRELVSLNIESTFHALQALLPVLAERGGGQVVIVTSASGDSPTPYAALYSATRAAANMLVKNAALRVAKHGVTLNAIGTNNLDYPGFRAATGADDPAIRAKIESRVPIRRLGRTDEVAHFAASLLDGKNMFQTAQFFPLSGGHGV